MLFYKGKEEELDGKRKEEQIRIKNRCYGKIGRTRSKIYQEAQRADRSKGVFMNLIAVSYLTSTVKSSRYPPG